MAVLTPMISPWMLRREPPELRGLMAASVWMKRCGGLRPVDDNGGQAVNGFPKPRLPDFEDNSGRRAVAWHLIYIQFSKNISGFPTMVSQDRVCGGDRSLTVTAR